jgi:OmpA-OmpF porin, OOP family
MKARFFLLSGALVLLSSSAAIAQGTQGGGGAAGGGQGQVTFGAGASGTSVGAASSGETSGGAPGSTQTSTTATKDPPPAQPGSKEEQDWADRDRKMNEAATLTGGVGLVHTQHAQGGAAGQFRVGFTTEYMSAGFLCSTEFPCRDPRNPSQQVRTDSTDHIGGRLTLSMQVLKWLEPYMATGAFANSNPNNRPTLLQVLGDTTLGAKAHGALSKVFHAGGAFELWLINGTGSVGLDGGGTSLKFRGLATADLRGMEKPVPLRFSINTTYVVDNTGEVVADTERARGTAITRIERFGLNINRVDHFDIHLGGEFFAAEEKVRPFLEYHIMVPVNRQDYRCRPNNPSNDRCMLNDAIAPSSLTLGGRFFPWKRGFNLLAALDIGVTGVGFFIEEMRPTPPWMLYLGAGWAFDTVDRPPIVKERVVGGGSQNTGRKIRGFVHEEGNSTGVAGAIVAYDNHPELTSLVTGTDGRFTTHGLDEGPYVFAIRADGYKSGTCQTSIGKSSFVNAPNNAPGSAPPASNPHGGDVQLDCALQALPRVGNIVGKVKDAETGNVVGGAGIKVVDAAKKELTGTTDGTGGFRFEQVTPGEATVTIDAEGYLASNEKVDIKVRQDNTVELSIRKKPKNASVTVTQKEIVIRQQIQFAIDSAQILPASTGLLNEIADVLIKNPRIKKVEVQGHTDNTGDPNRNLKLSEDRANAVMSWLNSHGVPGDRLVAKGYGEQRPLLPNVTEGNKQRNRRVQFVIVDQDKPAPALGAPATKPAGDIKFPF